MKYGLFAIGLSIISVCELLRISGHEQDATLMMCIPVLVVYSVASSLLPDCASASERNIDIAYVCLKVCHTSRLLFDRSGSWLMFMPFRVTFRCVHSMLYMNGRVSAILDLFEAILECWAYTNNSIIFVTTLPYGGLMGFCCGQALSWVVIRIICSFTEFSIKGLLQSELHASDAKDAAERLLSGFCDSVVRLDHDMRIVTASPQLVHLLSPSKFVCLDVLG